MQVITKPLTESEILKATSVNVTGEEIKKEMEIKAECCVDHLCGCSS